MHTHSRMTLEGAKRLADREYQRLLDERDALVRGSDVLYSLWAE